MSDIISLNEQRWWNELEAYLCTPEGQQFILDDAVMGCLEVSVVQELLADYNLDYTNASTRKRFSQLLDKLLTEGY